MKTNAKITVVAIVGILVGYALGTVIGWPNTSGNLGNGDISKVSKFHKATLGSQASALEEKLKSDTLAFNKESSMVALINSRMTDFADLVDYAVIAALDKDELSAEVNSLINVRELSSNAVQIGKIAAASLEYLESGEKNELVTDYEQASQNLVVAFMMVDRQIQLGKQFVSAADEYLDGKSLEDVPEVALVRDLWAEYCAESAWLNGDKQEMKYWGEKTTIANSDIANKGIQKLGTTITSASFLEVINKDQRFVGSGYDADDLLGIEHNRISSGYDTAGLLGSNSDSRISSEYDTDGLLGSNSDSRISSFGEMDNMNKLGNTFDSDVRLGFLPQDLQEFIGTKGGAEMRMGSSNGKDDITLGTNDIRPEQLGVGTTKYKPVTK